MQRELKQDHPYSVTPIVVPARFKPDPGTWLVEQAKTYGFTTLLAHADDGVIWGRFANSGLELAPRLFDVSPPLRALTLHQVRCFGERAELLVWRDGAGQWQARLVDDQGTEETGWCFDEDQVQWGDRVEESQDGFTLVADGKEGRRHAVPLEEKDIPFDDDEIDQNRWRPLRLQVRHYLAPDDEEPDGVLAIVQSRLVKLHTAARRQNDETTGAE